MTAPTVREAAERLRWHLIEEDHLACAFADLMEAADLRRNVIIVNEHGFSGRWVAIPEEDFDRLRTALAAAVREVSR